MINRNTLEENKKISYAERLILEEVLSFLSNDEKTHTEEFKNILKEMLEEY